MNEIPCNPRVLVVTPEVTYLPDRMGGLASFYTAKAGGLADVSAALVTALFEQGADVHVSIPDYRSIFSDGLAPVLKKEFSKIKRKMPDDRIHLAEDRAFYYVNRVYSDYGTENIKLALAFQREVINNIIPQVQPDLIHCNDWMTGLIPAMARQMGIPCLFTVHNVHTVKTTLEFIEDRGIDAAAFWQHLFFEFMADHYESARETNPIDLLTSGVFAAHFVNVVSPNFLTEIVYGQHDIVYPPLRQEVAKQKLGLIQDDQAPIFFWPSRLDPIQKGCQLLGDILYDIISDYWSQNLQVVFVANGHYQAVFRDIVNQHGFHKRVAIYDFDFRLEHQAYAACDFILMPSSFEPCGLPQMIAPIYGTLPVAHDTGGIHDTISHLDVAQNCGNGFLFDTFDSGGLFWAMKQAMNFYNLSEAVKDKQIQRIMNESAETFTHARTARQYIALYERMLERPLILKNIPDTKACQTRFDK